MTTHDWPPVAREPRRLGGLRAGSRRAKHGNGTPSWASRLPHLQPGSAIVDTKSVTAYKGSPQGLDYSATKGAIVVFTRSLSQSPEEVTQDA